LIQRRLERVPAAAYGLLQLAAVLGRQIDLAAL
jgi:predicted ATPase